MASLELYGFEELAEAYLRIIDIPWPVMEKSLDEMAEAGLQAIKAQGESMNVRDPESDVHILDSLKRRKAKKTDSGGYEDVAFSGSRLRHEGGKRTSNAVIAFENEYGNRKQPARPFVDLGLNRQEDEIMEGADSILDWMEDEFNRD